MRLRDCEIARLQPLSGEKEARKERLGQKRKLGWSGGSSKWLGGRSRKAENCLNDRTSATKVSQCKSQYMSLFLRNYLSTYRLVRLSTLRIARRQYSPLASTMASTFPPPAIREMAAEVSTLLKERSQTVCVAETVRSASQALSLPLSRGTIND